MPKPKVRASSARDNARRSKSKVADRNAHKADRYAPKLPPRDRTHRWKVSDDRRAAVCAECAAELRVELAEGKDGRIASRILRHGPARCPKRSWWRPSWDRWGSSSTPRPPAPWEAAPTAGKKGGAR